MNVKNCFGLLLSLQSEHNVKDKKIYKPILI
jgi:hypothetical protein